jgi:hypothetical protein
MASLTPSTPEFFTAIFGDALRRGISAESILQFLQKMNGLRLEDYAPYGTSDMDNLVNAREAYQNLIGLSLAGGGPFGNSNFMLPASALFGMTGLAPNLFKSSTDIRAEQFDNLPNRISPPNTSAEWLSRWGQLQQPATVPQPGGPGFIGPVNTAGASAGLGDTWMPEMMWQYGDTSPLAGVPESYWADRLNELGATLPWAQLELQRQQLANSTGNNAAQNALAQQSLVLQAQELARRFGLDQQTALEAVRQFNAQFGEGTRQFDLNYGLNQAQLGLSRDQLNAANSQFGQTFGEGQRQFDLNYGLNRDQFNAANNQFTQTFGEGQRQYNQNFGEGQRQFDLRFAQTGQQAEFQNAMNQASLEMQRDEAEKNRRNALDTAAVTAFGRRFLPSAAAM